MANPAPDFTLANNPHALIHCGPIGSDREDDGRDLTIITGGGGNHIAHYKNGNKTEHIEGAWHEVSGLGKNPKQNEAIARSITAHSGDIVINAERGNIKLIAKNILMETSGTSPEGNFLVSSNGYIVLASTEEVRLAGTRICINGTAGVNIVSGNFINMSGDLKAFGPVTAVSAIKNLVAGNWGSLIEGLTKSCGSVSII